jgi:hypothetical protein
MSKFFLLLLLTSCATLESSVPFENRVWDMSPKLDGFVYGRKVCTKKFLGFCRKKEIVKDKIEVIFKNKEEAKRLFDANFILMQRKKPI